MRLAGRKLRLRRSVRVQGSVGDLGDLTRNWTPLRIAFLHPPRTRGGAGPLATFVRGRREVALDLLLLAHTLWPLRNAGEIVAPASDWARAIGIADRPGSRAMISRSWSWLEAQDLIASRAVGQLRGVKILRDDGSRRSWEHPAENDEPYFKLPVAVWRRGLWIDLSLSAKAVLLIGLSLQSRGEPYFELPVERGAQWYGLTSRAVRTGLHELDDAGLMRERTERRETPNSPVGYTYDTTAAIASIHAQSPTYPREKHDDEATPQRCQKSHVEGSGQPLPSRRSRPSPSRRSPARRCRGRASGGLQFHAR